MSKRCRSSCRVRAIPVHTKAVPRLTGMLERFPADFQKHSLLRIQTGGLSWSDTEELRIEAADVAQIVSVACEHLARSVGMRIEESFRVPTVGGKFAGGVHPIVEELPKRLRSIHVSRE